MTAPLLPFDRRSPLDEELWDAPRPRTLIELVDTPAAIAPGAIAYGLAHHGAEPEGVTWGELQAGARARAAALLHAGIERNDRVLLMLPTSAAFFDSFFGVLLAGGIPVPVAPPPSMKLEKLGAHIESLQRIAADCQAAAAIGLTRTIDLLGGPLREAQPPLRLIASDTPLPDPAGAAFHAPRPGDTALLQYTSGSTSDPKGVELTHANILANTAAIIAASAHRRSSGVFWLPLFHDMGLIGTALSALYCRRPAIFMPPQAFVKRPAVWLRTISDYRATMTVAPNFAFSYCVKNLSVDDLAGVSLSSLELAMNGSEPVDPDAVAAFHDKFRPLGLRSDIVRPVYGLAESALAVTFADPGPAVLDRVDAEILEEQGHATACLNGRRARTFISVGRPIPTQDVRIVSADGRVMPEREVGEITVRGPSVMKGYFGHPAESAAALKDGWLHTGDLGYVAGGQLFITGRLKDIIIRHGKNYHAQDIEQCIARTPGLIQGGVAVFGLEVNLDHKVIAVVEARAQAGIADGTIERAIRQACQDDFLLPLDDVRIVTPGTIPRTTSGKVRRQACRQWYVDSLEAAIGSPSLRAY